MSKTNREKNIEHEKKELLRVRPKQPAYEWKALQDVIHQWITKAK
jgi:hypothetical protein